MRAPVIARLLMVVVFVVVVIAVAMSWQPPVQDAATDGTVGADLAPGAVSRATDADYSHQVNGVLRFQVAAGRLVMFEGNRTTYDMGVQLDLYSLPDENGVVEVTRIRAEALDLVERPVAIDGDNIESVNLRGNVVATLPNGAELRSDELIFDKDELYTDGGARMHAGDIVIESKFLSYGADTGVAVLLSPHPESERPGLRGPVKIWSETSAGAGASMDLAGSANRLEYDVPAAELRLEEGPELAFPEAAISGGVIVMSLDPISTAINSIEARGDARAEWLRATGEGDYVASGEVITVTLENQQPQGFEVRTESAEALRPRFDAGEAGSLRGTVIGVSFGEDATITATGEAFFFPADAASGLQYVGADTLSLTAGDREALQARGSAEVRLLGDGDEGVAFTGPEARFAFRDGALEEGSWPAGINYVDTEQQLSAAAGRGVLDAASGNWSLLPGAGTERPRFTSSEFDVTADEIRLLAAGGAELEGAVDARLRGDMVSTVAPLFGGAVEIQATAQRLAVGGVGDRMEFTGNARVFQPAGDQLLAADQIEIRPAVDELEAAGNAFVILVDPPDPAAGRDEARTVQLSGRKLLIEGTPLRLTMAGNALLELEGQGRRIGGERVAVIVSDAGAWESLEVHRNVVMVDPGGTGKGDRLDYDAATGVVVIHAGENVPATFVNDRDANMQDGLGLRLEWDGDNIQVTAMQNGTTQLVRGGR